MRLFSALRPSGAAVTDLAERLRGLPGADRFEPRSRWHITLCFYGEAEPAPCAEQLRARLDGLPAPRLRLAGSGRFGRVYFAGVQEQPQGSLSALAAAGGAGSDYHPHLTLTRRGDRLTEDPLEGYAGPWFTPTEAVLLASAHGQYRMMDRFALHAG